jgi:predicted DNA-binding WGR domain protein
MNSDFLLYITNKPGKIARFGFKSQKLSLNTKRFWKKNNQKSYSATIQKDILGWWTVCCAWSGINSKHGNQKIYAYRTKKEAEIFLLSLSKRRTARGYMELTSEQHQ